MQSFQNKESHFKIVFNESRSDFEIYSNDSRVTSKCFEADRKSLQYGSHLKMLHLYSRCMRAACITRNFTYLVRGP